MRPLFLYFLAPGLLLTFAQPGPAGRIDDFDAGRVWSAIGQASAEADPKGFAGGCMHMRFGIPAKASFAIVQAPTPQAAEAWEAGAPDGANAFVFQAKASEPIALSLVLRVRERGVDGPQGVRGHLRASVAVASADWHLYAVRFADFQGSMELGPAGDELFRRYHPQLQFHAGTANEAKPVDIWVDQLAFGTAEVSSRAVLPVVRPGLAAAEEATRFGQELPSVTVPHTPRTSVDLRDGWVFVPWLDTTKALGDPQPVSLPHGWPGKRDYHGGWYLRRLHAAEPPVGPVQLHCGRISFWSALFVDGTRVGEHAGGFTPFSFDIGPRLSPGEHVLALYVQDSTASVHGDRAVMQLGPMRPDRARARGGLLAGIELRALPPIFVADTFVTTSVAEHRLRLACEIRNEGSTPASGAIRATVRNWRTGKPADVTIPAGSFRIPAGSHETVVLAAPWQQPQLWSPEHPHLHVARIELIQDDNVLDTAEQRFGFREFSVVGNEFHLNGVPIRLRGESNLRGHSSPVALNREWVRTLFRAYREEFGANAFRVHASIGHETVFEVADEEGILLIDQSAIWSAMGSHYRRGGAEFMRNTEREFAEWVRRDRNHPSVVIWDVENEMIRGGGKRDNLPWVMKLDGFVRRWDSTRPVSHSGAGWYDPKQDLIHVHMEEHYTKLFEIWRQAPAKPLINGEYWVGGRGEFRLPSSLEVASHAEFWAEEVRLYHESIIEQRAAGVAGIMPFTISRTAFLPLFEGRPPIVPPDPADPDPRPRVADATFNPGWLADTPPYRLRPGTAPLLRNALGPVTAFFWPRQEAAPAAGPVSRQLVVCNDRETTQTVQIAWGVAGGERHTDRITLAPAASHRRTVELRLSEGQPEAEIYVEAHTDNDEPTRDELTQRRIDPPPPVKGTRRLYLTDTVGATRQALKELGVHANPTAGPPDDPEHSVWIIGSQSATRGLDQRATAIHTYLAAGGRILCLSQPQLPAWVPVRLGFWSTVRGIPTAFEEAGWQDRWREIYYSRQAPIYAQRHPVFEGLEHDLRWWHPTDGRVSDDSLARPAATGAVAPGAWRALAGGTRRESIGLAEAFVGQGSLLLCWFHVDGVAGANPEARRLLGNALSYLASGSPALPQAHVVVLGSDLARRIERLTGARLPVSDNIPADGDKETVLLAGDGAKAAELSAWAARTDGTVLVLSAETSQGFPGLKVERRGGYTYGACRGEDHPLFWGLASCGFEDLHRPAVVAAFSEWPETARVLLRGRRAPTPMATRGNLDIGFGGAIALDEAGAAAVALSVGKGTIIATTLEPFDPESPNSAEILGHLLTNAGVPLVAPASVASRIRCLQTVPLVLDGKIDDWTNDVEDRNVSPFRHAEPVVLGSESTVTGEHQPDQELSAILYLLWNNENLYLGGVAIGPRSERQLVVDIGKAGVRLDLDGRTQTAVLRNGDKIPVHWGELDEVRSLVDTRLLTFAEIDARVGNVRAIRGKIPGRTFEMAIPWKLIGGRPTTAPFAAELQRPPATRLRIPASADPADLGTLVIVP